MSDQINVVSCSSCGDTNKIIHPIMYTNAPQNFAVWWEPYHDPQIDDGIETFVQMLGPNCYLATAPRIKDWNEFKETIKKFERGELKAEKISLSNDGKSQMDGFLKHLQERNKKQSSSGCMLSILFCIIACSTIMAVSNFCI